MDLTDDSSPAPARRKRSREVVIEIVDDDEEQPLEVGSSSAGARGAQSGSSRAARRVQVSEFTSTLYPLWLVCTCSGVQHIADNANERAACENLTSWHLGIFMLQELSDDVILTAALPPPALQRPGRRLELGAAGGAGGARGGAVPAPSASSADDEGDLPSKMECGVTLVCVAAPVFT